MLGCELECFATHDIGCHRPQLPRIRKALSHVPGLPAGASGKEGNLSPQLLIGDLDALLTSDLLEQELPLHRASRPAAEIRADLELGRVHFLGVAAQRQPSAGELFLEVLEPVGELVLHEPGRSLQDRGVDQRFEDGSSQLLPSARLLDLAQLVLDRLSKVGNRVVLAGGLGAVSYTHLTLPTIYSV